MCVCVFVYVMLIRRGPRMEDAYACSGHCIAGPPDPHTDMRTRLV